MHLSYSTSRHKERTYKSYSIAESFREGWRDVKTGRVHPVDTLWDGIDTE